MKKYICYALLLCFLLCACGNEEEEPQSGTISGADVAEENATDKVTESSVPEVTETPIPEVTESPVPEVTGTPLPEEASSPSPAATQSPEPSSMPSTSPDVSESPSPDADAESGPRPIYEEGYIYYQLTEDVEWYGEDYPAYLGERFLYDNDWGVHREGVKYNSSDVGVILANPEFGSGEMDLTGLPTYIVYYCEDGTAYIQGTPAAAVEFAGSMSVQDFDEAHPRTYGY